MRLTVILPIYNERENLLRNFPKIYGELKKLGSFEIIIAEDGSNDGTAEVCKRLSKLNGVTWIHKDKKQGRGAALKNSIRIAKGNVISYMDIDLAVPIRYIKVAVEKVEEGNKFVAGSRYKRDSDAKRTAGRLVASLGYNTIIHLLFNSKVNDHQCGFKFWDAKYAKKEAGKVQDNHWFFDTEMILRAQKEGIIPYEIPVEWHENRNTKVKASDVGYFLKSAIKLRLSM